MGTMRLRWADIGNTTEAGVFRIEGREISISPEHIRIWREHPEVVFAVIELRGPAGLSSYSLDIRPDATKQDPDGSEA